MNWLCWHVGTVTDPKFGRMAEELEMPRGNLLAVWALVLEAAKDGAGEFSIDPDDAAYVLGYETQEVMDILSAFEDRKLIDGNCVVNWEGRQHAKSTERVRKHRERTKRDETDETVSSVTKRSNVTETDETPTDRQTDRHTNKETDSAFAEFWLVYPLKKSKGQAERAYRTARKETDAATLLAGARRYSADPSRKPEFTKHAATWLNGKCWLDDAGTGSTAVSGSGAVVPTRDKSEGDWAGILARFTPDKKFWPDDWGRRPDREGPWKIPAPLVLAWRKQHGIGQKGEVA